MDRITYERVSVAVAQLKIDDARVTAEECVESEIQQRILSPMWRAHSCVPRRDFLDARS